MTTATHLTDRIRDLARAATDDLVAIRHDLHAHPELGYEEHRTSGVIQRELESLGIEFVGDLAGGTGVLGHLPGRSDRAIGLRADIDALPIVERTGLPYASTHEGRMHACGHDGHTTMLLGAARVLSELAKEGPLPHPVTFCFQPAEEGGAGGERMVQDGCLDGSRIGPPVQRMYGLHGWPLMPLGRAGSKPGPLLAAADMFDITVRGVGGHAATPNLAADPVLAAAAIVQALQQIVSRHADPTDSVVVSVTKIDAGTAHNIIPETAHLKGTVRTIDEATRQMARGRLHEIAERTAAAYGCTADVAYHDGYPVTINDPAAYETVQRILGDALGTDRYERLPVPTLGGEDFSYYGRVVPSCFFFLGLLPEGRESMPKLHQATFDFTDAAIPIGVELLTRLALDGAAA